MHVPNAYLNIIRKGESIKIYFPEEMLRAINFTGYTIELSIKENLPSKVFYKNGEYSSSHPL